MKNFVFFIGLQILTYGISEAQSSYITIPIGEITGIAIHDALAFEGMNNCQKAKLLTLYLGGDTTGFSTKIAANHFLSDYKDVNTICTQSRPLLGTSLGPTAHITTMYSSLEGLDVTDLADGIAKFLVKRTKEELSITFFKKFKDDLKQQIDLGTLFPNTTKLLQAIDDEIYFYNNYINNLREAFRADLNSLEVHLPDILENHAAYFNKQQRLALALKSASYISSSLKQGIPIGDVIENFPMSYFNDSTGTAIATEQGYKGALQTLQLLSGSLKAKKGADTYWVSIEALKTLVQQKTAFKIYWGLLQLQAQYQYDSIQSYVTANLIEGFRKMDGSTFDKDYTAYKEYLLAFGYKIHEINTMLQNNEAGNDSSKIAQYARYSNACMALLQWSTTTAKLPYFNQISNLKGLSQQLAPYFDLADEMTNLMTALHKKRYPEAMNHLIIIYNDLLKDAALSAGKNAAPISGDLLKYGAFMANMVTAKSSDEVAATIEAVALPAGSAQIKRVNAYNVAINAYVGLYGGAEQINDKDGSFKFNTFGLTAPIGLSISKGHALLFIPTGKYEWSSSLFFSFIDLGAIAAFRFNDTTSSETPKIQLKDIVAPGVFLSIGIPKSPISVNLGAQIGPNLRQFSDAKNAKYADKMYLRLSAAICADIPIFNLYSSRKR